MAGMDAYQQVRGETIVHDLRSRVYRLKANLLHPHPPALVPSPPQQFGMSQSISPAMQSYPQSAMSGGMGGPTSGLPNGGMNNNMTR